MNIHHQEIISIAQAKPSNPEKNVVFKGVMIDSRQPSDNGLFIAIRGKRTDGHFYLNEAFQHGARGAVIDHWASHPEELSLYMVEDTEAALKKLGGFCSRRLTGIKLAITGTVGKTTTKFFFQKILGICYRIAVTPLSYNTTIGVSSSFCNFSLDDDYYIIEAGINKKGEMNELAEIIDPGIVVFTAFGRGHLEGFEEVETVVHEKILLAQNAEIVYLNGDNPYTARLVDELTRAGKKVITYGYQNSSAPRLSLLDFSLDPRSGVASFHCRCEERNYSFQAPIFSPELTVMLLPVLHLAFHSGIAAKDIQKVLDEILLPQGREKIYHRGSGYVIDDSYNANPVSMYKALRLMDRFNYQGYQTWVVLGDMLEMGNFSDTVHEECIRSLEEHHIKNVILFGSFMHEAAEKVLSENSLDGEYYLASSHEEIQKILLDQIPQPFERLVVLFKGSRGMKLEEAIPREWKENDSIDFS